MKSASYVFLDIARLQLAEMLFGQHCRSLAIVFAPPNKDQPPNFPREKSATALP